MRDSQDYTYDHGDQTLQLTFLLRMVLNELLPGLLGHVLGVEPGALWPLEVHGEGLVMVLPVPGAPHHVIQVKLGGGQLTGISRNRF